MVGESQIVDRDEHYVKFAKGVVYDAKTGLELIDGLLETGTCGVWSAEQDEGLSSSLFDFSRGSRDWHSRTPRAYAVRAQK